VVTQPFNKPSDYGHESTECSLNSSKEKSITKSTFLHKGCLPIPQLFGARKLFFVWVFPYKKEFRRYATASFDSQRR
jgi:hypothetical protein